MRRVLVALLLLAAPARAETGAELFAGIATVLQHPRCMNCHTTTDWPRQTDARWRHAMNARRGAEGHGLPGMRCSTCHQAANQAAAGVPGALHWHLAPLSMGWEGLAPGALCRVLVDPSRNGGRDAAALARHMAEDPLVAWAWAPGRTAAGTDRASPPMPHAAFAALVRRWAEAGAACPP